ncbi:MAG: hypothetical protein AAGA99_00605 [Actinomycetota bacterium]
MSADTAEWTPKTKAEQHMKARYRGWSKRKRYERALKGIIDEGWTVKQAADDLGLDQSHLAKKAAEARRDHAEEIAEARVEEGRRPDPLIREERRVGEFWEWERNYFSHILCPDCGVRHEAPDFHRHMIDEVENPDNLRVLVNTPPYHSKSTLLTVKHTLYEICRNPNLRTAIVSSSQGLARDFLGQIGEFLMDPDIYTGAPRNMIEDWGPFKVDGSTWNREAITVGRETTEKDATVSAWGIFQRIYGRRFDRIKFDDIADVENMRSPDQVIRMLNNMDKMFLSRIGKTGKALWAGTRISGGDVYKAIGSRPGYVVIRYSAIQDEETESVLWGEHFPWRQVMIHRSELTPADFQLIYQNVDAGGIGMSFTEEMIDSAKDHTRTRGQWDPSWRLIAGLDPAGGGKDSGFTAFILVGVDMRTGVRYLIDIANHQAFKAPQLKQLMLDWSDRYRIDEWRVESNGVQSQLVLYNDEITRPLAARGVKVTPHYTHTNKADPVFGVDAMAPLFTQGLVNIPWGDEPTRRAFEPLTDQLLSWGYGAVTDCVMAWWFSELGVKDLLNRQAMPLFDRNMRVPRRIRRKRMVVDFGEGRVRGIPMAEQRGGHLDQSGQMTVGRPMDHAQVRHVPPAERPKFANVEGEVEVGS